MKLMVVESPNKVKKIESILGDGWKVVASVGHVRDLPKHDIGLEAPDFALQYEYIPPAQVQGRTFPGGEERVARADRAEHFAGRQRRHRDDAQLPVARQHDAVEFIIAKVLHYPSG